jgi:flagellar basal-body rod protein FlgG
MIRGLYTSGWSMLAINRKMDTISNNLANVDTTAFKKDTVVYEAFPDLLTKRINDTRSRLNPSGKIGTMELGSDVGEVFTYYTQGQLNRTENRLDLAISKSDSAFFTVGIPDEYGDIKEYYTRDGSFVIGQDNMLLTKDGYAVIGEDGPIMLDGDDFAVSPDGILIQNGVAVGKLKIADFTDVTTLRKFGRNLVERTEQTEEQEFAGSVEQGFLEQSNVDIVREMVDMITVMRSYEANQKILMAQDSTLEKAVNEVGAVR